MQAETHKKLKFPVRLAAAMKRRGFTQEALAAKLGISHSAVSRWISGSAPRPSRLAELATLLGVTVSWLEGDGPEEPAAPALDMFASGESSMLREEPAAYTVNRSMNYKALFERFISISDTSLLVDQIEELTRLSENGDRAAAEMLPLLKSSVKSRIEALKKKESSP